MAIVATQIRTGMVIVIEGELYKVVKMDHVTPGKGVACVQTKLKHVINPKKNLEKRFRSNDRVEQADLFEQHHQYLYSDGEQFHFMNPETFDQIALSAELLGDKAGFLIEETNYGILMYQDNPIELLLPQTVTLKVTSAPPEVRKATASASLRPITVENGMTIQAPVFIKEGDMIKINTDDNSYIERVR